MLTLRSKQYEIEETIQLLDENENEVYSFEMKLTNDEVKKLQKTLIGKDTLRAASKLKALEEKEMTEENIDKVLELTDEVNKETFNIIDELCFKEHKAPFIEKGGQNKYEEMVEIISDFLLMYIMKKQTKRQNTMISDLNKIGKN